MFKQAIVRLPGDNFASGLTRFDLGVPELPQALEQHSRYCAALERCGLAVTTLPADPRFPDGTFVEDTAIVLREGAMITRPGAVSRLGEVTPIRTALHAHYPALAQIVAPGTVDGGDICEARRHVFIGLSERTNAEGAAQLAQWLAGMGYTSSTVAIHGMPSILHLKSGMSWIGEKTLLVIDELASHPAFADYQLVRISAEESYAANAIRVNAHVLLASGFPRLHSQLQTLGYSCIALDMSEFEKMDGGLSCLSLRF